MHNNLALSVRALVDFSCRSGDLFSDELAGPSHLEGIRGHQKIQKSRDNDWQSEYATKHEIAYQGYKILLSGRVDLLNNTTNPPIIEEIKTTYSSVEKISEAKKSLHWAQAKVYAFLCAVTNNEENRSVEKPNQDFCVRTTWFNLLTNKASSSDKLYSYDELKVFTEKLLETYLKWHKLFQANKNAIQKYCKKLEFPHGNFRAGQYDFSKLSYLALKHKQYALIEAPTGIGKTISALFPATKAIGEGLVSQVVYLTAKGSIQEHAAKTVQQINKHSNTIDFLVIQAKSKACPCRSSDDEVRRSCDSPEGKCTRTLGFYDRLPQAREDCLNAKALDSAKLRSIADDHDLCPFELSLQMIRWASIVICDYNYVFDPLVHLAIFDESAARRTFIIDEIHNLPDRGRDMYSAYLSSSEASNISKTLKKHNPTLSAAASSLARAIKKLSHLDYPNNEAPKTVAKAIDKITHAYHSGGEDVMTADLLGELPIDFLDWIKLIFRYQVIQQLYGETHKTFLKVEKSQKHNNHMLQLRCLDASVFLASKYKCARSLTGFSATLNPLNFYQSLLKLEENTHVLQLPSSFPISNQLTLRCDFIDTRWQAREDSLADLTELIYLTFQNYPGKHIVFFPSYDYLNKCHALFINNHPSITTATQTSNSSDQERKEFLDDFFENNCDKIGFAIMGGIFGEAIDFTGDALHSVIIVGSGMPQPTEEQKLIQEQFQQRGFDGHQFAFQYPGFTRVQQTAGRVIRSESDKGLVILVDPRFQRPDYMALMPGHWQVKACKNLKAIESNIKNFKGDEVHQPASPPKA